MASFDIGKTIKDLRTEHQYSQLQLGELLNVADSTVSKWESGDSNPNIEQISNIGKIFGMTVDELLNYQNKKDAERIKMEEAERKRQTEKNLIIKDRLNKHLFRKIWDKQRGYDNGNSKIETAYDGKMLTLYQNENPNIVLYDSVIGSDVEMPGKCFAFHNGEWEQCPCFDNMPDRWQVLFDFNNPIERIRFSFDEKGIDEYEFLVKYVYADKEAYYKKIEAQKRKEQMEKANIQVYKSVYDIDIPGNYGPTKNNIFTGVVNVTFNAVSSDFSYAIIELFSKDNTLLKVYRLNQGEKIWMEDKICGNYSFVLKQYDGNNKLIFQSDLQKL